MKNKRRRKYTCAHCKTGIVGELPATCPECNKMLNEAVKPAKCCVCGCKLTEDNRAQWEDHCEGCETKVFEFYGAVEKREWGC